eukprot:TRINITY_DN5304_c0_g1_i1.p1 TRINITY_DN5304_c0_g1~~TRINITY_DN5304_c0_g1_i1.p1  ORF type:complete len:393 (-),score=78.63 TRINITY_DN5304_c0_g1_i1:102-1280(-)
MTEDSAEDSQGEGEEGHDLEGGTAGELSDDDGEVKEEKSDEDEDDKEDSAPEDDDDEDDDGLDREQIERVREAFFKIHKMLDRRARDYFRKRCLKTQNKVLRCYKAPKHELRGMSRHFMAFVGKCQEDVQNVVSLRPGDWKCGHCGDIQFACNQNCRLCGHAKEEGTVKEPLPEGSDDEDEAPGGFPMRPGDWRCPKCRDHQFARNTTCRRCGESKPPGIETPAAKMAEAKPAARTLRPEELPPGDWLCPECNDHQFARNLRCRRCNAEKPMAASRDQRGLTQPFGAEPPREVVQPANSTELGEDPDDWQCQFCFKDQYSHRTHCKDCGTPKGASAPPEGFARPAQMAVKPEPVQDGWHCAVCGAFQFARFRACRQCGTFRDGGARSGPYTR